MLDPRCSCNCDVFPGVTKRCQFSSGHKGPHTSVSDIDARGDFIVTKWGDGRKPKTYNVTNQDLFIN